MYVILNAKMNSPGTRLWSLIPAMFRQFSAKKMAFFLKKQCYLWFNFWTTKHWFESKNGIFRQFWSKIFLKSQHRSLVSHICVHVLFHVYIHIMLGNVKISRIFFEAQTCTQICTYMWCSRLWQSVVRPFANLAKQRLVSFGAGTML
jgi:hypothetical protein